MAKKKWFQTAGLILVCHLTISACQATKEVEPEKTSVQTQTSKLTKKKATSQQAEDKKSSKSMTSDKEKSIPGVTTPTSDGFILTDQSKILSRTKDGIIVDHDGHSHFVFYSDLQGTKFAHLIPSGTQLTQPSPTSSGGSSQASAQPAAGGHHYTFNPADIVAEDALGYTVRHDDHYHYILKSSLGIQPGASVSGNNGGAANLATAGTVMPAVTADDQVGNQPSPSRGQGIAGIDYPTSDGFLFNGSGISGWTDLGLLVDHGGHLHMILKRDLARSKWAHLLPNQSTKPADSEKPVQPNQPIVVAKPSQPTSPDKPSQSTRPVESVDSNAPVAPTEPPKPEVDEEGVKRAYLAAATGLSEDQILLINTPQGPAFMYPHENHHHVVPLSKLDVTKPFDDGHHGHDKEVSKPSQPTHSEPTRPVESSEQVTSPVKTTSPAVTDETERPTTPVVSEGSEETKPVDSGETAATPVETESEVAKLPENPGSPTDTTPAEPEQPETVLEPTEVEVKRAYLAAATGLPEDKIILLNTPAGPSFMYPHGNHDHVVLLSKLDVNKPYDDGHGHHDKEVSKPSQPTHSKPAQPVRNSEQPEASVQKGFAGIDYPTSDGFLFDGTGMAGWTSAGLLVDHKGHTHILSTEAISKSKWAHLLPKKTMDTSTAPLVLSENLTKQRDSLAKQFGLKPEDLRVVTADGKVVGFEYPHEDHYDFVPVSDGENPSGLTDEDKRELTAYIRKTYGLLLGTPVNFHDGFVVFAIPHPHQDYDAKRDYYSEALDPAYDPGHVHPYAVPLSHLSVLKPTGNLELDFENELIAAAKRIGIAPSEVKIKDKKYFVLPGKDHDHYLNILTPIAGYDAYMANKLPDIKANFALGDYSKADVETEADRILAAAEEKFGSGTVEFRRVARALEAFKVNLSLPTTSTDGYLKALQSFENKHLNGLIEEETEDKVVDPLVTTYLDLSERLKGYDERTLKNYGIHSDTVISDLKTMVANKDEAGLARVATHFAAIDRSKQASSDLAPRSAYMDYFLKNLDSDKLPASLRQEVINKLIELQKISGLYRNPQKFREGLESTALLKERVKTALAAEEPAPDHANWTPYPRGFDRKEMANTVNSMRDFLIKNKEMTDEEMSEGFGKKLELFPVHPKKPTSPVVTPPAQPKPVEEVTKPTEIAKPEVEEKTPQPTPDKKQEKPISEKPADTTQPLDGNKEVNRLTELATHPKDNASDGSEIDTKLGAETQPTDETDESVKPVDKLVGSSEEPTVGEEGDTVEDSEDDGFDWSGWKPIFDIPVDNDSRVTNPEDREDTELPVWKPIFDIPVENDRSEVSEADHSEMSDLPKSDSPEETGTPTESDLKQPVEDSGRPTSEVEQPTSSNPNVTSSTEEKNEEFPTPVDDSDEDATGEASEVPEDKPLINGTSDASNEVVVTEKPLEEREQPSQPRTEAPEEGTEIARNTDTDDSFDWSGWSSILNIPEGEENGYSNLSNNFTDFENDRREREEFPVWRPLFERTTWNEDTP